MQKIHLMKQYLLASLFFIPIFSFGQAFEAELLGHWSDDNITPTSWLDSRYNDVWGTVQNGQEFAVFGSTEGVHFIDLSDPTNPTEVGFVMGAATGNQLVHRDYHSYNGYLYTVADEGPSSLQVIAMHDLPNSVELVYDSNELLTRSHNIYVDSVNAVLYSCGGNGGNSLKLISLANPEEPTLLAAFTQNTPFSLPNVHDIYVRNHLGFVNCGNQGFYLIDFSNPTDPVLLGILTDYPQKGYNHSGWLADDQQHYYMCDETHGMDIKVVDVSDPSDMSVVNLFSAESTDNQIVHNAIVRGDYLYVSYYYDGVQIFDISDPANPVRFSYFDTFDGVNDSFFQGSWGVYPLLPSGIVLVSDMNNGLFIVDPFGKSYSVKPETSWVNGCTNDDVSFDIEVSASFENPVDLALTGVPANASVIFSENPAMPGSIVKVTISNLDETGSFSLGIMASDGDNEAQANLDMEVESINDASTLNTPADQSEEVVLKPYFEWAEVDNATNYRIAIASDNANFDGAIIFQTTTPNTNFQLLGDLNENQTYYWRVSTTNDCGDSFSEIFAFTTEFTSSISEINGNSFFLFPNPTAEVLNIRFEQALEMNVQVELLTLNGTQLIRNELVKSSNSLSIDLSDLSNGVYFMKLISEDNVLTQKVIIQK